MAETVSLNARIVEALYCEALVLSDEVRACFALSGRLSRAGDEEDLARVALSCEGLRTTTRMMHAIAWLLNQRAFLMGELSEFQMRRHGRLSADSSRSDPEQVNLLDTPTRELVAATERFHARLLRLDSGWRDRPQQPALPGAAIARLRERLSAHHVN